MPIPKGYEVVEEIPAGYEPVEEEMGVMDTLGGVGNIIGAGVVGAGKKGIEGLGEIGGLMIGRGLDRSISEGQATANLIPDVPIGENAQRIITTLSEKYKAAPQVIQDIIRTFANGTQYPADKVFDATGSPFLATTTRVIPDAMLAATGMKALNGVPVQKIAKTTGKAIDTAGDVTRGALNYQGPAKQRIAKLIQSGSSDIDTAKYKLKLPKPKGPLAQQSKIGKMLDIGGPRVATDKIAAESIKQGFDEGAIAAIKAASPADKRLMSTMVTIMEKGKKNARFAAVHRPSDIAGDSLMRRVRIIQGANKEAGRNIDNAAKSLRGKPVDISKATSDFSGSLDDLGVKLVNDGKGGFRPDFEFSQLGPGDRGPLKEVIRQMNIQGAGGIDGLTAHKMKRIIDNNVTFGRVKTGISGDAERVLKDFRLSIDKALDSRFPEYNRLNEAYSETIGALNTIQDVAGKKMNLVGPNADKATGVLLRRVLSNAQSRVTLLDSIDEIEKTARKYKGFRAKLDPRAIEGPAVNNLTDDLLSQVLFVDELDNVFGPAARTSFHGQIKQAVKGAAGAAVRPADTAVEAMSHGAEKLRGINQENAFKAIRKLLAE